MNIFVVWAQYSDKSDHPEFIRAFKKENRAFELTGMLSKVAPNKEVMVSEIWLEDE